MRSFSIVKGVLRGASLAVRSFTSGTASSCSSRAYETSVSALASRSGDVEADVVYLVGGLYGNTRALAALDSLVTAELASSHIVVCFNGDFNFFNASVQGWLDLNRRVRDFGQDRLTVVATLGNVEHQVLESLGGASDDIGCGCAYPSHVDESFPVNASEIVRRLHEAATAANDAPVERWLKSLPFSATMRVGDARLAAVHGDPTCVNGWGLGVDAFSEQHDSTVQGWLEEAEVDIFGCTHTCLPLLRDFKGGLVANNGAAGIGNFADSTFGVVTRVAAPGAAPPPVKPLYGARVRGVTVDALPLHFDVQTWLQDDFLPLWPKGSAAHDSYFERIRRGVPGWQPSQADQTRR